MSSIEPNAPVGRDVQTPEGFAYIVSHEAWYAKANRQEPEIMVGTYADGPGTTWEFGVRQVGNIAIRAEVFSDAFTAFNEIPEFFSRLAGLETLTEVRRLLDELGAVDKTTRERPEHYRDPVGADHCWDLGPRVGENATRCVLKTGHGGQHQAHHSLGQVAW